jgi:hypothetical protein
MTFYYPHLEEIFQAFAKAGAIPSRELLHAIAGVVDSPESMVRNVYIDVYRKVTGNQDDPLTKRPEPPESMQ